jgi:hypothetical protein
MSADHIFPRDVDPCTFPGAFAPISFDTGVMHGPTRADLPPIIAHRFECPSCGAIGGEPCRLSDKFTQDYSHIARHRAAQRSDWRALMREMNVSTGWTIGPRS